jgi:hypothetical protein
MAGVMNFLERRNRLMRLCEEAREAQRIRKFYFYAKAAGHFLPEYLDDEFYTDEQADFFWEYEVQMAMESDVQD